MYWQPEFETMDRGELLQFQLERLQTTLNRVVRNVPLYRRRFAEKGIDPDDFTSLDDLRRLPFTTKEDIRDNYPYGLFAVPLREVVRLQSSSGVTGKPTVVGYTRADIRRWADLAARILCAGGLSRDDVLQVAFHYGLFTGGFGLHYGAERLGASVIPISSGNAERQALIMQDYRTTALACTPSYALHLADVLNEMDLAPSKLHLKYCLLGAEAWSEAMREEIQKRLNVAATDNYGVSELLGPGVAGECLERQGMHCNEDHFLFEVLDPESGAPVPDGDVGELVVTSLTKEAFPMIRFRTGDLTRRITEPCACGRTLHRISRVLGRCDDMLTIRGINVFPSQVEAALVQVEGATPHYQIIIEREDRLDKVTVLVEAHESHQFDLLSANQRLVNTIAATLEKTVGVDFDVKLVEKRSLDRSEGKAKRIVDKRTF